jgi:SAM-dependent methyltransferase
VSEAVMNHWQREAAAFNRHLADYPGADYRDWQPTKWQSLETVRDQLLQRCWNGRPGADATALELGCGSATLLVMLAQQGVACTGIDRDAGARNLAVRTAASLRVPVPELLDLDFFDPDAAARLPVADVVFHVGVIEHYDRQGQLDLLRLSARQSRRWVMIGIPHEHGPVFSGFLRAVTAADAVYDHDHEHIDVPALVQTAGFRLAYADGAHLFYSTPDLYTPGDPELDGLYRRLRDRLVERGGARYAAFPHLTFGVSDIPVLRDVEESLTVEERYNGAFLRWYLVDVSSPNVTSIVTSPAWKAET